MPHRLRKVRRQRGSRTHGWGQVGQHRKHGMKGGRGKSGLHKHKWSYTTTYAPEYFADKGFTPPSARCTLAAINVGELEQSLGELTAEGKVKVEDGKYHVDLSSLGYEKLLGGGRVTKPIIVKARFHSESATKKIEEAGGHLVAVG